MHTITALDYVKLVRKGAQFTKKTYIDEGTEYYITNLKLAGF